jgi:hypothetical protein
MVFIESAYLGDEKDMRNVTDVVLGKITGTTIKVPVDDKLIPPFAVTKKTSITTAEEKRIKNAAKEACGGPDQACIAIKEAELTQQSLLAKTTLANSSANLVRGRRLTVTVVDDANVRRRVVVPDGHEFELSGLTPRDPRKPNTAMPPLSFFKDQLIVFGVATVSTFVWVFGVVATLALFGRLGWGYGAWALALVALLVPGSGYVMIIGYFLIQSFVRNYTAMV